jgi:hypothetical protein
MKMPSGKVSQGIWKVCARFVRNPLRQGEFFSLLGRP